MPSKGHKSRRSFRSSIVSTRGHSLKQPIPHHHHHHHHHHVHHDHADAEKEEEDHREKMKTLAYLAQKLQELATRSDIFATAHILPVHALCIWIATIIIPVSAISIIWDLMAAVVFQIPALSTINTPAFVLFINFVAIPLAIYGYMMEYLMHEHSRLAVFGLISVVVHPILFLLRALMEYYFDGFRGENKIYFEAFSVQGKDAIYPIGLVRYKDGVAFSDSDEGRLIIKNSFTQAHDHDLSEIEQFGDALLIKDAHVEDVG